MKTTAIFAVMSIAAMTNAQNLIDTTYGTGAGSFELPGFTNANAYTTLPAGSTAITGWTVDPTELDWVTADYWNSSAGSFSLDLNGWFVAGGIHTVIPTVQGESYEVSFDLAGFVADGSPSNPKSVEVSVGTNTLTYSLYCADCQRGQADSRYLEPTLFRVCCVFDQFDAVIQVARSDRRIGLAPRQRLGRGDESAHVHSSFRGRGLLDGTHQQGVPSAVSV